MTGRAQPLVLGPFVDGINNAGDPSIIQDSELVDCVNFETDIDGSLITRPPIFEVSNFTSDWTERILIIGRAVFPEGNFVIGSNATGTYSFDGTNWVLIRTGLTSCVALQYQDRVWIVPCPGEVASGGSWSPTLGFVADANMPQGESAVFHKARMFIVPGNSATTNTSRIRFTDPIVGVPFTWTGSNIIDVSPGDGEKAIEIIVYSDNLLILKNDSTYVLAYDLLVTDGIVRKVSSVIGVTDKNCAVEYQNSIFVFHEGNVYELVDYNFTQINFKTDFIYDATAPTVRKENVFLSLFGARLVLRFYNNIYVYNLNMKNWTRWESASSDLQNFGPLVSMPSNPTQYPHTRYYGGSSLLDSERVYCIKDGWDSSTIEQTNSKTYDIKSSIKTKNYDLSSSHHYKKMMWWGADVLCTRDVFGGASPIVVTFQVTWNDLRNVKWNDLSANTWDMPLLTAEPILTGINTGSSPVTRKFLKFPRTLRFRQIFFTIEIVHNGSSLEGPAHLFSLTAMMSGKQIVEKAVN